MTWNDLVAMAMELPEVELGTSYGTAALKVRQKLLARLKEDGETVVLLQVDDIERQFLIETQPEVFYLTPHYIGWPTLLIHLSKIDPEQMRELLEQTWARVAPKSLLKRQSGAGG